MSSGCSDARAASALSPAGSFGCVPRTACVTTLARSLQVENHLRSNGRKRSRRTYAVGWGFFPRPPRWSSRIRHASVRPEKNISWFCSDDKCRAIAAIASGSRCLCTEAPENGSVGKREARNRGGASSRCYCCPIHVEVPVAASNTYALLPWFAILGRRWCGAWENFHARGTYRGPRPALTPGCRLSSHGRPIRRRCKCFAFDRACRPRQVCLHLKAQNNHQ